MTATMESPPLIALAPDVPELVRIARYHDLLAQAAQEAVALGYTEEHMAGAAAFTFRAWGGTGLVTAPIRAFWEEKGRQAQGGTP